MIESIRALIDFVFHIDVHLTEMMTNYQGWTYLILILIIFAETGLVVTPFLPGDSLLFAAGALLSKPGAPLNIYLLAGALSAAAILGDLVNYHVGKYFGPQAFSGKIRFLRQEYLVRAHSFYERYGGKTIIYARFIPIIRTFAPFVAGIGTMSYRRFAAFNVVGGVAWVTSFLGLGFFFGGLPIVKTNFTLVVIAIIFISVLQPIGEIFLRQRRANKRIGQTKP
jgi:membrane-associated protein